MNADGVNGVNAAVDAQRAVEELIDDVLTDTFPASDPPSWESIARRIAHAKTASPVTLRRSADSNV